MAVVTHGMSRTPTYNIWCGMISRCRIPNRSTSKHYFDRGIKVCERWSTFENFLADMGQRPTGMTLDRIDSNGDYGPDNCRWASPKEQRANNGQPLHLVEYNGKTQNLLDWATELGIKYHTLYARFKRGLPLDRVFAVADLRL